MLGLSEATAKGAGLWVDCNAPDPPIPNTYIWARDRLRQIAAKNSDLLAYFEWMIGKIISGTPNKDKRCFILWGEHDNMKSAFGKMFEMALPHYYCSAKGPRLFNSKSLTDRPLADLTKRPVRMLYVDEATGIGDGSVVKSFCGPLSIPFEAPRSGAPIQIPSQATLVISVNKGDAIDKIRKACAGDTGIAPKIRFVECPARVVDDPAMVNNESVFLRKGETDKWLNDKAIQTGIRRYFVELGIRYAENATEEPQCHFVTMASSTSPLTSTKKDLSWDTLSEQERSRLMDIIFRAMDPLFTFPLIHSGRSGQYWTNEVVQQWNDKLYPVGKKRDEVQQKLLETAIKRNPLRYVKSKVFVDLFNDVYEMVLESEQRVSEQPPFNIDPTSNQKLPIVVANEHSNVARRPPSGSLRYPLRFLLADAKVPVILPFTTSVGHGKRTSVHWCILLTSFSGVKKPSVIYGVETIWHRLEDEKLSDAEMRKLGFCDEEPW